MSRRKVLGDRYRVGESIGQGSFASVYNCEDMITKTKFAVKVLNKHQLRQAGMEEAFERETAALKMLPVSPHVTNLVEVLQSTRNYYLIMDLADGGNLLTMIAKNNGLPAHVIRKYFTQILSGLRDIHSSGVVHRDIKPENLLLDDYRNLRIADFSFAAVADDHRVLKRQCGTPHYVAPEVLRGEGYNGRKADIWSVGVSLFVMVFGQLPFVAPDTDRLYERICSGKVSFPHRPDGSCKAPESLRHLINCCLRTKPEERWSIERLMRHPWLMGKEYMPRALLPSPTDPHSPTTFSLSCSPPVVVENELISDGVGPTRQLNDSQWGLGSMSDFHHDFVQLSASCPAIVWKKYLPGASSSAPAVAAFEGISSPTPRGAAFARLRRRSSANLLDLEQRGSPGGSDQLSPSATGNSPISSMSSVSAIERQKVFLYRLSWDHARCALHLMFITLLIVVAGFLRLLFGIHLTDIPLPKSIRDLIETALTPPPVNKPRKTSSLTSQHLGVPSPTMRSRSPPSEKCAEHPSVADQTNDFGPLVSESSTVTTTRGLDIISPPSASSATTTAKTDRMTPLMHGNQPYLHHSGSGASFLSTDDDLVDTLKKGSLVYERGDWRRQAARIPLPPVTVPESTGISQEESLHRVASFVTTVTSPSQLRRRRTAAVS